VKVIPTHSLGVSSKEQKRLEFTESNKLFEKFHLICYFEDEFICSEFLILDGHVKNENKKIRRIHG